MNDCLSPDEPKKNKEERKNEDVTESDQSEEFRTIAVKKTDTKMSSGKVKSKILSTKTKNKSKKRIEVIAEPKINEVIKTEQEE